MSNNMFDATISNIIGRADFDISLGSAWQYAAHNSSIPHSILSQYPDMGAMLNCIKDNCTWYDKDLGNFNRGDIYTRLYKVFAAVTADSSESVVFSQTAFYYIFKVEGLSFCVFLPLVTARVLMSMLKTFGVKCTASLRSRNLCADMSVFLTELCFQGKTTASFEGSECLGTLKDICKGIKGKINPWSREYDSTGSGEDTAVNEGTARFSGAEWFENAQRDVSLIGTGGIGSNIAVSLCRVLGNRTLTLFDPDTVEHRNLAGQNFGVSDIGKYKKSAVAEQCMNFNPRLKVETYGRFDENHTLGNITITGLDNMAARSLVFSKWQGIVDGYDPNDRNMAECRKLLLLIDARLSAEKWQIFCITGDNKAAQEEYADKWLFSDSDADSDVCSYKQTAFAAQMCASFVTNLYINFCANFGKDDNDPLRRYLPFMTEYDASQMILRYKDVV